jgi:hypothetical protein
MFYLFFNYFYSFILFFLLILLLFPIYILIVNINVSFIVKAKIIAKKLGDFEMSYNLNDLKLKCLYFKLFYLFHHFRIIPLDFDFTKFTIFI